MSRRSPAKLKADLKSWLSPEIGQDELATQLSKLLRGYVQANSSIGQILAAQLTHRFSIVEKKKANLNRVIECFPSELDEALKPIRRGELQDLIKLVRHSPVKPSERTKAKTESERTIRRKKSKKSHDRLRPYRPNTKGRIEAEFTDRRIFLPNPFADPRPTSDCLDVFFKEEGVGMSELVNLFGMDRHRFPRSLPRTRIGRRFVYGLPALLECMTAFLSDGRWIQNEYRRRTVLRAIIHRAKEVGKPAVFNIVRQTLRPHLKFG